MNTELTRQNTELTTDAMHQAGRAADHAAAAVTFADYITRKAAHTVKRQARDLALFAEFLQAAGVTEAPSGTALQTTPAAWRGITWGLTEAFVKWLLQAGYAVGTVNLRLSTLKTYAKLALKAGTLDATAYTMIRAVAGYSRAEAARVDARRDTIRRGTKKAEATPLPTDLAAALRSQPETPQGRRDSVIVTLLADLGLRVDELARLTVEAFDLDAATVTFYRPKVDMTQTHELKNGTLAAVRKYFDLDAPAAGPLLRSSHKGGKLTAAGMSVRAIQARVKELGARVGLPTLSPHDLRHFWATRAARNGTPLDRLMQAGGWSSPSMPMRYVHAAEIANAGVIL